MGWAHPDRPQVSGIEESSGFPEGFSLRDRLMDLWLSGGVRDIPVTYLHIVGLVELANPTDDILKIAVF